MVKLSTIKEMETTLSSLRQTYAHEQSKFKIGDYIRTRFGIFKVKKIIYMDNKNGFRLYGHRIETDKGTQLNKGYLPYWGDRYDDFEILERPRKNDEV